ncbi:hypothetical protein G6L37_01670 [Agrobacterium rubi]|nr:hypothetical protein [Agrobacterium rubi]NTF24102.1 hypothetical protein [Agrobacterium rubi]
MGFQSDIYLGWTGRQNIVSVIGQDAYDALLEKGENAHDDPEIEGASIAIRTYLGAKYGEEALKFDKKHHYVHEEFQWEVEGEDVGEEFHIFGIPLTSRYFPQFLDFRERSGGLYVKRFNKDLHEDIEWFRTFLVEEKGLKHYESAEILVLDRWY